jgi:hypothetical protein
MNKPPVCRSDGNPVNAKLSADSEGLGYWGNKIAGTVGYVSEVNGSEAREVSEFVPTKHELIQITKYWIDRILDNDFFFFTYAQTGSTEWRINSYANRRINRAAEILSAQEFDELIADAERDFRDKYKISDEDWNIFRNGSQEDWQLHQNKVRREFESKQGDPSPVGSKE